MNRYIPPILSALIGLIIGLLVFSRNPVMKLIGVVMVVAILLYFRKQIQEVFLETEANKVIAILFVAVLGAGTIIIDNLQKTQWQLLILWGAWILFCIILLGRLSSNERLHLRFGNERVGTQTTSVSKETLRNFYENECRVVQKIEGTIEGGRNMEQPSKGTTLLVAILLTTILIAVSAVIALTSQQATPFQQSEDYWNQVHVSEYLAEKTWNGSANVIRAGLGRVVVEVDGRAYEYRCEGAFNCTEGFVNETALGGYRVNNSE